MQLRKRCVGTYGTPNDAYPIIMFAAQGRPFFVAATVSSAQGSPRSRHSTRGAAVGTSASAEDDETSRQFWETLGFDAVSTRCAPEGHGCWCIILYNLSNFNCNHQKPLLCELRTDLANQGTTLYVLCKSLDTHDISFLDVWSMLECTMRKAVPLSLVCHLIFTYTCTLRNANNCSFWLDMVLFAHTHMKRNRKGQGHFETACRAP